MEANKSKYLDGLSDLVGPISRTLEICGYTFPKGIFFSGNNLAEGAGLDSAEEIYYFLTWLGFPIHRFDDIFFIEDKDLLRLCYDVDLRDELEERFEKWEAEDEELVQKAEQESLIGRIEDIPEANEFNREMTIDNKNKFSDIIFECIVNRYAHPYYDTRFTAIKNSDFYHFIGGAEIIGYIPHTDSIRPEYSSVDLLIMRNKKKGVVLIAEVMEQNLSENEKAKLYNSSLSVENISAQFNLLSAHTKSGKIFTFKVPVHSPSSSPLNNCLKSLKDYYNDKDALFCDVIYIAPEIARTLIHLSRYNRISMLAWAFMDGSAETIWKDAVTFIHKLEEDEKHRKLIKSSQEDEYDYLREEMLFD